jgi:hypothetical protein
MSDGVDLRALPRSALNVPLLLDFVVLDDVQVQLSLAAAAAATRQVMDGLEEGSG